MYEVWKCHVADHQGGGRDDWILLNRFETEDEARKKLNELKSKSHPDEFTWVEYHLKLHLE